MTEYSLCKRGHVRSPDNLSKSRSCKQCNLENNKQWRNKNIEKARAATKRWEESNKDRVKENHKKWYSLNSQLTKKNREKFKKLNPEKQKGYSKKWGKTNQHVKNAITRKYCAKKNQRSPKWLSKEQLKEIESFYLLSKIKTLETGVDHHVDHIVPLQGINVSGLHVPWNLQVITAIENCKKNNRFML